MKRAALFVLGVIVFLAMGASAKAQTMELVRNGGFEQGKAPWVLSGRNAFIFDNAGSLAHSGGSVASLGDLNSIDSCTQQITIPTTFNFVTLSFWLKILSSEPEKNFPTDFLTVNIIDLSGNVLGNVITITDLQQDDFFPYTQVKNVDMSQFKGRTVRLSFVSTNDSARDTGFLFDDVSVLASNTPPPDFNLLVSPTSQTIPLGSSTMFTIALNQLNGFNDRVDLSGNFSPADSSFRPSFSQTVIIPGVTAQLNISTSSLTQAATYTINIFGKSGTLTRMETVTVSVVAGPFINVANFDRKKTLTIIGSRFGTRPRVFINGAERTSKVTTATDSSIGVKGKAKKLGLVSGDNRIQVMDSSGKASNVFILRL